MLFVKKMFTKSMLILLVVPLLVTLFGVLPVQAQELTEGGRYQEILDQSTKSISKHIDASPTDFSHEWVVGFLVKKIIDVLFPVIVILGVLVAIIGFYKYFSSSDPKALTTAVSMIVGWVVWILLMFSASYISKVIFNDIFLSGLAEKEAISALTVVTKLYDLVVFPFIKIAIYLALWILVVLMIARVISYILSTDEAAKKKSIGVVIWTAVGMFFIIASKQIVEAIYGKQEQVLTTSWANNLWDIGSTILQEGNIPIFYQIINWALALVSFVILLMIMIQTFKLIAKPDDSATLTSLKKTILYSLIGILVIWAAYILANLLVPN